MQLDWIENAQFAGLLVAKEKGWYTQQGLDVTIEPVNQTTLDTVMPVVKGAIKSPSKRRAHNERTVFERYSIASRQVIFVARAEAGRVGSPFIDTEHVLLGILRVAPAPPEMFAQPLTVQGVNEYATRWHTPTTKIPTSVDLPIHADTEAVFDKAFSLADLYECGLVRTEHLLLALATVTKSHSAVILEEVGVFLDRLEAMLSGLPVAEQQAGNSLAMEGLLPEMF